MTVKALNPSVKVELGGKERTLLFNFNAMAKFEEVTGVSILNRNVWDQINATNFRALIWACLLHEDKELKVEDVGEWLHFGNVDELSTKLSEAWTAALPKRDGDTPLVGKKNRGNG